MARSRVRSPESISSSTALLEVGGVISPYGQIIGASTPDGGLPDERPIGPNDVLATP
jgi:hypothetical protein